MSGHLRNLMLLALILCASAVPGASAAGAEQPNIVFFFIDDLGWTDVGYMYGQLGRDERFYETPHIDQLAVESLTFLSAYANAPNCAPSRACLMSGQYTPRHGIYTVGDPRRGNDRFRRLEPIENETVLADRFITMAEALDAAGYATASMGKWHLGRDPRRQGFDVNIAGREWGSPSGGGYHSPFNYPNLSIDEEGVYLTDALTDAAVSFIHEHREGPFFLYLTHYAVHTPIQAKPELVEKYRARPTTEHHSNPKYAAMIEGVDDSVGRVLATLDELDLAENTLVLFFSDNGGFMGATSNDPLRGAKGMLYEGGIREPMIVRWPGVTPAGAICEEPVIGIDLYPTLLEITGTPSPADYQLDGVSLVPLLEDPDSGLDRDALFWHFPCYLEGQGDPDGGPFRTTPAGAIRMGNWKLIEWFETGRLELYNLADDVGESRDLSRENPEQREALLARMRAWRAEVDAPIPTTPNPRYRAAD